MAQFKVIYLRICLERLRKSTRVPDRIYQSVGRDLNPGLAICKAGVIITRQLRSCEPGFSPEHTESINN